MSQDDSLCSDESHGEGNTNIPRVRARRWCYTLNNYSSEEMSQVSRLFANEKYFVQGEEVGAEGTPHLQGYVEFKHQKDLKTLKKINPRIHWEKARGNRKQNEIYCKKDNNYLASLTIGSEAWLERSRRISLENFLRRRNSTHTADDVEIMGRYYDEELR